MQYMSMTQELFAEKLKSTKTLSWGYYHTEAGSLKVSWISEGIYEASFVAAHEEESLSYMNDEIAQLPLLLIGTPFQQEVWRQLLAIMPGATIGYADLAQKLGRQSAYRAVANAVGANKIAYFVPCHRVVRKNGDLGGYRWGVAKKAALLESEKR